MSRVSPETVEAAEQRVRTYLAKRAGRPAEAEVPRSEREPFGAHIELRRGSPEIDALFSEIGFPFPSGPNVAFQHFIEQSSVEQERILLQLVKHSREIARVHDAATWLYDEVALSCRLTQPFMSVLFRTLRQTDRPDDAHGMDAERNALILNLIDILRVEFGLSAVASRATVEANERLGLPDNDACGIVVRVLNEEFPKIGPRHEGGERPALNLSHGSARNVWERHRKLSKKMAKEAWDERDAHRA
ncbi:hypothetical protein [Pseudodonghicola xiamenensis]|uniref:Uncharacterized protein n=1 Tax=Pseudodonghicola xiamenensis TaxID=337702 RepID=A0A8J3HA67_9RHOB|nr:hypothetical protein [Pseudodonghicola xiamenensis]GHH05677.1 hypothetical protein GCM10010961_44650 [Pseudodonghicola xiamenensis]